MSQQEELRERLGRKVREVWIAWAKEQSGPKPSWLVPWNELSETDKEADRRIGIKIWEECIADIKKRKKKIKKEKVCPHCGSGKVVMFDADNDLCQKCGKWFPAILEGK